MLLNRAAPHVPGSGGGVGATNLALTATATASSESTANSQFASCAIDGVIDGYPGDYTKEWATNGQGVGAWIRLTWASAQSIQRVVLYDRPNANDNILSGTLTFSDGGSSVAVGALDNSGAATVVDFTQRSVTWVQLTVNSVSGTTVNAGLAEFQVFGPA